MTTLTKSSCARSTCPATSVKNELFLTDNQWFSRSWLMLRRAICVFYMLYLRLCQPLLDFHRKTLLNWWRAKIIVAWGCVLERRLASEEIFRMRSLRLLYSHLRPWIKNLWLYKYGWFEVARSVTDSRTLPRCLVLNFSHKLLTSADGWHISLFLLISQLPQCQSLYWFRMRDFLVLKLLNKRLHLLFLNLWISLYMLSFVSTLFQACLAVSFLSSFHLTPFSFCKSTLQFLFLRFWSMLNSSSFFSLFSGFFNSIMLNRTS